jgi:hypothetical protein
MTILCHRYAFSNSIHTSSLACLILSIYHDLIVTSLFIKDYGNQSSTTLFHESDRRSAVSMGFSLRHETRIKGIHVHIYSVTINAHY